MSSDVLQECRDSECKLQMGKPIFQLAPVGEPIRECISRGWSVDADDRRVPVCLHVYDVTREDVVRWMNSLLLPTPLGGAFHAGVEVGGLEWSFGLNTQYALKSGVQCVLPQRDSQHNFRQTVHLGCTELSAEDITATIRDLIEDYPGMSYDVLHRNCCHFADDFCKRLGVGPIPAWLQRMAALGASADDAVRAASQRLGASADDVVRAVLGSGRQSESNEQTETRSPPQAGKVAQKHIPTGVDVDQLCKALLIAEDVVYQGRGCELYPIDRTLSMALEAEEELLDSLGDSCRKVRQSHKDLDAREAKQSWPQWKLPGRGRNGKPLSRGGC
jgi:hypothetical protein